MIRCNNKGSIRRRVARLALRYNWRHWQRIVFKRAMYPALRGAACDWASEARWIAAEAVSSRSSKGLGAGSCCGYTGLAVYAPSQSRAAPASASWSMFKTAGRRRSTRRVIPQAEPNLPEQGRWSDICRAAPRLVVRLSFLFRSVGRASDVMSLDEPRAV
jgi:hypothetical protein